MDKHISLAGYNGYLATPVPSAKATRTHTDRRGIEQQQACNKLSAETSEKEDWLANPALF